MVSRNLYKEEFLGNLDELCSRIITSSGVLSVDLVAAAHECGLRACLLLSIRYSSIQVRFLSSFFTGSAFSAGISQELEILADMAQLRGFILSLTKEMISTRMAKRSEEYLSIETAETLSFGDLSGSLPIDLPFYKLVELATVYSSPGKLHFFGSLCTVVA